MKRLSLFLLLLLAFLSPTMGQEEMIAFEERVTSKDSLPDLWIVLLDKTGSMTRSKIRQNLSDTTKDSYISRIFGSMVSEYGNSDRDVFVLLEFGAQIADLDRINGNSINYSDDELVSDLIHVSKTNGSDYHSVKKRIGDICGNISSFSYGMSYTSVVRPLSIYVVAKKMGLDFLQFRNVYSLLITDNGDNAKDQWSSDYNTSRYRWKKHFACFTKILPTIASSEFDFTSVKSGKFNEVRTMDVPPYYFLNQYVTYQERHPETKLFADTLVTVSDFHDNRFNLQMNSCCDSVNFVYVETCYVNSHPISVNQYLYRDDTIHVVFDKAYTHTFSNKVSVDGTYQEQYHDRVLGQRYRTVQMPREKGLLSGKFIPEETQAVEYGCLKLVLGFLLAIIGFLIIWRNLKVLHIFVDGMHWYIKRKAINKLKQGRFELLSVSYSENLAENTVTNVFFYKGIDGIVVEEDKKKRTKHGEPVIIIHALRKLSSITPECIERPRQCLKFVYEYNYPVDKAFFSFSERLRHSLIITSKKEDWQTPRFETNPLQERNFQMLASYCESNAKNVTTARNNVVFNLIRKESLEGDYPCDYAVINIFDLNYGNSCRKVLLRYSLMFAVDLGRTTKVSLTDMLLNITHYVLKSEHQEAGTIEAKPNIDDVPLTSSIELHVLPLLSYLYVGNGHSRKLIYSPFRDVKLDVGGCFDLKSKKVSLYRRDENLTLSNSPMLNGRAYCEVSLQSYKRKSDTLSFLGDGNVTLLGAPANYSYGKLLENTHGHKSYYAHNITEICQTLLKTN